MTILNCFSNFDFCHSDWSASGMEESLKQDLCSYPGEAIPRLRSE